MLADAALGAAILALGGSLVFSGGAILRLRWNSPGAGSALGLQELLAVAAAGAGIALLCWWLLALACALVSAVAQQLGAVRLARASSAFAPAFMRRLVAAVLGLNLLAAPMAVAAESPAVDPLWHPGTVAAAPVEAGGGASGGGAGAAAAPGVLPPDSSEAVSPRWVPTTAETAPGMLISPGHRGTQSVGEAAGPTQAPASDGAQQPSGSFEVVVKGGDSLWSIVAEALGPYASDVDVALAWPGWYRANRDTIGADPNIIHPGQILQAPGGP
ncbi:hypothetical protein CVV67_12610 [Arthrobacter stackebrandtii]|nr:hypothetical protein CVV67_12610 [Arthrobacter stackebrandtii]